MASITKEIKSEYAIRMIQHTSGKSFEAFNEGLVLGDFIYSLETKTDKDYIEIEVVEGVHSTSGGLVTFVGVSPSKSYMNIDHSQVEEGVFYLSSDNFRVTVDDHTPPNLFGNTTVVPNMWLNYIWKDSDGVLHNVVGSDVNTTHIQGVRRIDDSYNANYAVTNAFSIGCVECDMKIRCTTKIFRSEAKARAYLNTGDDSGAIDPNGGEEELAEDREVTLYYESDIFSRAYNSATSSHIGASNIHFRVQYKNNKGEEIVNPYRAICGYVSTNNIPNDVNRFGNITWIANNNINIIETNQHPVSGTIAPSKTIPNFAHTTGFYPPYIDDDVIYDARFRTNMRIFANRQDALDFLGGGNPTPIGESGNQFNPNGFLGDKTVFNDGHDLKGGGMSSCWIMNESQLEDLANVFQTGLTKVEENNGKVIVNITKTSARAFASHGEPIDAVVDLFWIPFEPSEFVVTGESSFQLSRDDLSSASSLIKFAAESGDTVVAHGGKAYDLATSNVSNVISEVGTMFSTTTQKVQNVGN